MREKCGDGAVAQWLGREIRRVMQEGCILDLAEMRKHAPSSASSEDLVTSIKGLIRNADEECRVGAILLCGYEKLEDEELLNELLSNLEESKSDVRSATAWALGEFGKRVAKSIGRLGKLLESCNRDVRLAVAYVLERIGALNPETISQIESVRSKYRDDVEHYRAMSQALVSARRA